MNIRRRLMAATACAVMVGGAALGPATPAQALPSHAACQEWGTLVEWSLNMWDWSITFYGYQNPVTTNYADMYLQLNSLYSSYC